MSKTCRKKRAHRIEPVSKEQGAWLWEPFKEATRSPSTQRAMAGRLNVDHHTLSPARMVKRGSLHNLLDSLTPQNLYGRLTTGKISFENYCNLEKGANRLGSVLGGRPISREPCTRFSDAVEAAESGLHFYAVGNRGHARGLLHCAFRYLREHEPDAENEAYARLLRAIGVFAELSVEHADDGPGIAAARWVTARSEDYVPPDDRASEDVIEAWRGAGHALRNTGDLDGAIVLGDRGNRLGRERPANLVSLIGINHMLSRALAVRAMDCSNITGQLDLLRAALSQLGDLCERVKDPGEDTVLLKVFTKAQISRSEIEAVSREPSTEARWEEIETTLLPILPSGPEAIDVHAKVPMGRLAWAVRRRDRALVVRMAGDALDADELFFHPDRRQRAGLVLRLVQLDDVDWSMIERVLFLRPTLCVVAGARLKFAQVWGELVSTCS